MLKHYVCVAAVILFAGCAQRANDFSRLERRLESLDSARNAAPKGGGASRPRLASMRDGAETATEDAGAFTEEDPLEREAGGETDSGTRTRRPLPSFGETVKRDIRSMPEDLWQDTKAVYGSAPQLVILGLTYGGSLALQKTGPDDTIEDSYRHNTVLSKSSRDTFNALGNPGLHFALAGAWYLGGQTIQSDRTYEVARTLFSALIINGVSTLVGQAASWDDAPNGERGTFPSGHTSSTFTLASVMHDAYGPLVGVPLYGLGVLVAMSRLEDGEHYFSDVVMGGVMGLVIGHTVAGEHDFELFGGKILPYADPNSGSSGVAWVKELKYKK